VARPQVPGTWLPCAAGSRAQPGRGQHAASSRPHRAAKYLGPVSGPPAQAPCTRLPALPETMGGPLREERRAPRSRPCPCSRLSLPGGPDLALSVARSALCALATRRTPSRPPSKQPSFAYRARSSPSLPARNEEAPGQSLGSNCLL